MATTVRLLAIVDLEGKVMAAQLSDQATDPQNQDVPSSVSFEPLPGQRVISIDVPQEVMELPGPDLHQFLSDIRVSWPVDIQLPEIRIVKKSENISRNTDQSLDSA